MKRITGIAPAQPGWWVVYRDGDDRFRSPIAAWVIVEESDFGGETFCSVSGIEPSGPDWTGGLANDDRSFVEYMYDPAALNNWKPLWPE